MALLEVKGITKRFGGLVAVDKLSFEVNENEIISIIGPNGAGKTTVFNMITGIYEIDEGEIVFNNEVITNKKSAYIVECGISVHSRIFDYSTDESHRKCFDWYTY